MSYRSVNLVPNEFYHVYNRGNSKQTICHDPKDFQRFQQLLFLCNTSESVSFRDADRLKNGLYSFNREQPLVAIGAYCVLSNHFHLLITPLVENGLTIFMQKVSTAYAMYYNKKYQRVGSLFEGRFQSSHASDDRYLKYLFAYIHLNPATKYPRPGLGYSKNILNSIAKYPYSSLVDYLHETRDEGAILNPETFPQYFIRAEDIVSELIEWIEFEPL